MPSHILIAHDLRDTADLALRRAAQLASQHHAQLTLLHILDQRLSQSEREAIEERLDRSLTQYAPAGSQLRLSQGKAADGVLEQVQQIGADLLVLGAHNKRHEFFSGTSLDRIARRCQIPILLAARDDAQPYQKALAAIDFSLCACSALHEACLLLPSDAKVHALHVLESSKPPKDSELELQRMLIAQLLEDEAKRLPTARPSLQHEVRCGTVLRGLQECLNQQKPQLLVLGSHGRGLISQALLGSTAQLYLHKAPCDVLVVH